MAKRRRYRETSTVERVRPNPDTRTDVLLQPLLNFEDRRQYHPDPEPPAGVVLFRDARVLKPSSPARRSPAGVSIAELLPHGLQFDDARGVLVCVRRKRRREVLFATKRNGRNGARRYRRNKFSEVSCR